MDIPFSANLKIDPRKLFDPNARGITDKQSQKDKDKIAENVKNAKEQEEKKKNEEGEGEEDKKNKKDANARLSPMNMSDLANQKIEEQLAMLKQKLGANHDD